MSTKVEEVSAVEPHDVQTTAAAKASAASTNSPRISIFAAKSGFVIPKNKLSGSLVPIYRGGKKPGGSDAVNEEGTTQVQRKTKWGPDLTQDAAVRKGRALAYQTRVEQITKQLNSGLLETGDNQDLVLGAQNKDDESSTHQIKSEKSELLELEKQEAIGEILKLNPSYKAPPDYKPLLKEAKVPVPIKQYPGYNFIGLIFGPASDTQKRLEKAEISKTDGNETHGAYEELYVQISADTYEKVDAAVALIELLVTPVSVNPSAVSTKSTSVSGDSVNAADRSQGTSAPYTIPPVGLNEGLVQPIVGSTQTPPQGQFQPLQGPWFPASSPQDPMRPPSGSILPPNSSGLVLRNPVQAPSMPFNPSNMPSLFGPRPILAAGLGSVPHSSSLGPSRPQPPVLQRPFLPQQIPPRSYPFPASQPPPAQPIISAPLPFTGNQPSPTGPLPPRGQGGMAWMGPPMVPPQRPNLLTLQPVIVSGAPLSNISSANRVPPSNFPPRPSVPSPFSTAGNHHIAAPIFTSSPQPRAGLPPASPLALTQVQASTSAPRPTQNSSHIAPMQPVMARAVAPNPSPNLLSGSMPNAPLASTLTPLPPSQSRIPSPVSGNAPSFTPVIPPSPTAPKPHHPSSSDFTFQPHRPQNVATQAVPRQPIQNMLPQNPTSQPPPLAPKTPSFWPHVQSSPQPVMPGIPRPQPSNHMNQPQPQISPFAINPTVTVAPLRHPAISNPNPGAPTSPVPQMGLRNLNPVSQVGNLGGPFPPRPGNPLQLQQNYPAAVGRPQTLLASNQQLGTNLSFASGRPASGASGQQQIYDPFSPTSVSTVPLQGGNPAKTRNQESSEYEDLMASVGVK
ncbi:RNA-binding KH domain-containing protein [Actinidia rufa]|uniref:RNA-binding KH domain-containing protein n=1 Tax=Actinidia rufa TaxID=165716 RepID=A0A7J0GQA5_9ERIC|nr:RNA-binding KH domain-containing protein [Actinidia rufa]